MDTQKTNLVMLNGIENWEAWEAAFYRKAKALELEDYVDLDHADFAKDPEAPEKPSCSIFKKKLEASTRTTRQGSTTPMGDNATTDEPAQSILDLTPGDMSKYLYLDKEYERTNKEYKTKKKAIRNLGEWMELTVSTHLKNVTFKRDKNEAHWFKALREQVGLQHDHQARIMARTKYREAIAKFPEGRGPVNLEAWLQGWEKAFQQAHTHNVGETLHAQDWWPDFDQVASSISNNLQTWCQGFRIRHQNDIADNTLTYATVASEFRTEINRDIYTKKNKPRKIARGAHAVAFKEETSDSEATSTGDQSDDSRKDRSRSQQRGRTPPRRSTSRNRTPPRQQRKTSGNKRRFTGGARSGCDACGGRHALEKCWVVIPSERPEGVKIPHHRINQAEEAMKKDSRLREQVDRINGKRQVTRETTVQTRETTREEH